MLREEVLINKEAQLLSPLSKAAPWALAVTASLGKVGIAR